MENQRAERVATMDELAEEDRRWRAARVSVLSPDLRETCKLEAMPSDAQCLATVAAVVENLTAGRVWDHAFDDLAEHVRICSVVGCALCAVVESSLAGSDHE
jgi:hypothetical protein